VLLLPQKMSGGAALVRARQAMYGKFVANIHQSGPGDSISNIMATVFALGGLSMSGFAIFSLMGHGKKIEGRG